MEHSTGFFFLGIWVIILGVDPFQLPWIFFLFFFISEILLNRFNESERKFYKESKEKYPIKIWLKI
jgi:hypothetical protein